MGDEQNRHQPGISFDTSTTSKLVVKITALFSSLILLVIVTTGLITYQSNRNKILTNLQNQLQLAANTIAISINGDEFETLSGPASMLTPAYVSVKNALKQFMVNKYLGFETNGAYTFRRISKDSLEFTVMLQEEFVGNHYAIRDEMLPTLERGTPSYTDVYEDENGVWLSAYAPITNSQQKVVGMVEVDFHNNFYLLALNDELYSLVQLGIFGLLLAVLSAILLSRFITRPINRVAQAAIRFSKGDLDISVPVSTRDEIGMLGRAFNYMVSEIKDKKLLQQKNHELSEAYQKLDAVNKSLKEATRLKSEFLSIAAHDLKSPLQVIMGFAERILNTPDQNETVYRDAQKIYRGSQRMLAIIKNLLDTTAIETGKLKLNKSLVDVGELASQVVCHNQPLAEKKQQNIELTVDDACILHVDEKRIYEVMDNLLNNAIKFSPPAQSVSVMVRKISRNGKRNGVVQLVVEDHGPGLTKADMKKLFGKFHRLSAQPTQGETSTGLGLSIAKRLVELHGGKIWAESPAEGKGAKFVVEIG